MRDWLLPILLWGCLTACVAAEPLIDGTTAPRWSPCTGWTTTPATAYSVTNENGVLVFSAQGANREMPWIIDLDQLGLSGDATLSARPIPRPRPIHQPRRLLPPRRGRHARRHGLRHGR